ncbi:MAG: DUF4168 domain-containing protein [Parvibaculum sp.]|nr:DUF4168 domain-containing protein [Parvibaculum sp.]
MRKILGLSRGAVLGAIVVGFSAAAVATPALATDRLAQAAPGQQQAEPSQYSDEDLQAFAKSVVEVQQINQQLDVQAVDVTDAAELESIQQQSYRDMEAAITGNGLTVQDYNQISALTQSDEEMRQKVTAYISAMDSGAM